MKPAFSSLKTCVVIAFSALLLASSLATTALAKFPRVPSAAPLKFHQDGTDLCLHARWSDAVLKDCAETNLGRQVWEHRPDFTLYNASRDRCLYRQSDTELGLAKCDGGDSAQQWRIAFVDGAYEIGPLDAPDRCVATAGDSDRRRQRPPDRGLW